MRDYILFLLSVFISSISQIALKKSSKNQYQKLLIEYINPLVIFAYGIFFLSTLLTMYAYKGVPLSIGPILEGSGYIFVSIMGYIILHEKVGKRKKIGLFFILAGILITCTV